MDVSLESAYIILFMSVEWERTKWFSEKTTKEPQTSLGRDVQLVKLPHKLFLLIIRIILFAFKKYVINLYHILFKIIPLRS